MLAGIHVDGVDARQLKSSSIIAVADSVRVFCIHSTEVRKSRVPCVGRAAQHIIRAHTARHGQSMNAARIKRSDDEEIRATREILVALISAARSQYYVSS